jgi:hypothetical protein
MRDLHYTYIPSLTAATFSIYWNLMSASPTSEDPVSSGSSSDRSRITGTVPPPSPPLFRPFAFPSTSLNAFYNISILHSHRSFYVHEAAVVIPSLQSPLSLSSLSLSLLPSSSSAPREYINMMLRWATFIHVLHMSYCTKH